MHEKYTFATFLQRGPAYREWQGRLVRGQGCLASHVVRVVVADQGASSGPRLIDDPMAESGRGLLVVRELSALTGVAGDERGRLVWAEITWNGDAPQPSSFPADCEAAISDGRKLLARRRAGVPTWFGYAALQWWAVADRPGADRLVAAVRRRSCRACSTPSSARRIPPTSGLQLPSQTPWRHGLAAGIPGLLTAGATGIEPLCRRGSSPPFAPPGWGSRHADPPAAGRAVTPASRPSRDSRPAWSRPGPLTAVVHLGLRPSCRGPRQWAAAPPQPPVAWPASAHAVATSLPELCT